MRKKYGYAVPYQMSGRSIAEARRKVKASAPPGSRITRVADWDDTNTYGTEFYGFEARAPLKRKR